MNNSPNSGTQDKGKAFPNDHGLINCPDAAFGEVLGPVSYSTCLDGKWHLGSNHSLTSNRNLSKKTDKNSI
ncbi:hypothetical protein CMK18_18625 [Candidatus Poribacteria bacterium]|nr:hypothetical protein [Candidatus Poribacteria bacterium]